MRIAHFSDIHFFALRKNPLQIFSKRFLGNMNFFFSRKKHFDHSLAIRVVRRFKELGVTHLIITGDYTCTSSKKEFELMKNYVEMLKTEGFTIFTLPGNHDAYTNKSYHQQIFYKSLEGLVSFEGLPHFRLNRDRVALFWLQGPYWLILIDCAIASKYTESIGRFSKGTEIRLIQALEQLPKDAHIVVAGHFPYDSFRPPYAHLERGENLQNILENDRRICAYLHGHRHDQEIEKRGHLWLVDSGSISLAARSSFNLLELSEKGLTITPYRLTDTMWEGSLIDVKESTRNLV